MLKLKICELYIQHFFFKPVPIKKAKYRLKMACIGDNVEELEEAIQSVLKELPTEDEDVRRGKKRLEFIRLRRGK